MKIFTSKTYSCSFLVFKVINNPPNKATIWDYVRVTDWGCQYSWTEERSENEL